MGLGATAWAALAAIGSMLAAIVSAGTALYLHRASGARIKAFTQTGLLRREGLYPDSERQVGRMFHSRTGQPVDGLEVLVVTVVNVGRTAATVGQPGFAAFEAWWSRRRLLSLVVSTSKPGVALLTQPLQLEGVSTDERVRIEPNDQVDFIYDRWGLFPAFADDGERPPKWHHVAGMVPFASEGHVRFQSAATTRGTTFREFAYWYVVADALTPSARDAKSTNALTLDEAFDVADSLVTSEDGTANITRAKLASAYERCGREAAKGRADRAYEAFQAAGFARSNRA